MTTGKTIALTRYKNQLKKKKNNNNRRKKEATDTVPTQEEQF